MMYAYSVSTKRLVVVAVATLAVVMCGQRAGAQPGWVLSHQKISSTQGGGPLLGNGDQFGRLASLGDLNGDGVGDLAVGAFLDDDGGFNRGAVWILFLNTDGTVNHHQKISSTTGGGPPLGNDDFFGIRVASLGDLDGDGPSVLALAVGAFFDDDGGNARGAVWILFLNADGTVRSDQTQKISSTTGGGPPLNDGDQFGIGVASLGDLNGDGVADLAVGAWRDDDGGTDRGAVWILFLNTDGTVRSDQTQKISDTEGGFKGMLVDGDGFGLSGGSLGDFDGEGPSELALAVGAAGHDEAILRGAVWVLFLNSDGTVNSHKKISDTEGGGPPLNDADAFGVSVGSLGDLDGDGVGDLAVGAFFDNDGGPDRGAVWILFLNSDGTVRSDQTQKISSIAGGGPPLDNGDLFGTLASLGDLNGDGVGDLAVGAQWDDDGGFNRGAVWILFLDGICLWDLDANGSIGASDLLSLLVSWGPCKGCPADFDRNGSVGASDLLALLVNWGPCP